MCKELLELASRSRATYWLMCSQVDLLSSPLNLTKSGTRQLAGWGTKSKESGYGRWYRWFLLVLKPSCSSWVLSNFAKSSFILARSTSYLPLVYAFSLEASWCMIGSVCAIICTGLMGVRFNKSLCTSSGIGKRWTPDHCGEIDGALHTTVVYEKWKFTNSFVRLRPGDEGIGAVGVGVGHYHIGLTGQLDRSD